MIGFRRLAALALVVALGCLASAPLRAEEISNPAAPAQVDNADVLRRMAELEKEVQRLRGELQAVKAAPVVSPNLLPAVYNPQAAAAAPAAAPEKKEPGPFDGFLDVLGGATLTGFVDTYYGVNFNQPPNHLAGARSWDNLNSGLALNMVNLALDKAPDAKNSRVGYHVGLAFGNAMNIINGAEPLAASGDIRAHNRPGWDQYLMEAYFSYLAPVGKNGLQFDVGKFVTPTGAEVVPTKDDWNYTRSLLYDFAIPIYHYGVRAKYTWNDKVNLTGFVLNGWNDVVDNNSGKTFAVSLGLNPTKKLSITQNYMAGPQGNDMGTGLPSYALPGVGADPHITSHWRQLIDTTIAYAITPKLTVQTNIDYARGDRPLSAAALPALVPLTRDPVYWTGAANYIRYTYNAKNAFTVRHEYFLDHDGFATGAPLGCIGAENGCGLHFHELTATYEHRFAGHMISRFEYRHDMSNRDVFADHSSPKLVDNQNTLAVGLIYVLQKSE